MRDALIVDAVRSPIGKRNGTLAAVRADELAAQILVALAARLDLDPGAIDDLEMGCVTQIGEQALNVGRIATLVAGWPETVCASTIDRQCGSSMQAAMNPAAAIQAGHLDVVVAAGVESMSRVPMGSNLGEAGWFGFSDKLLDQWQIVPQGISAEVIAEEWGLSRERLDEYFPIFERALRTFEDLRRAGSASLDLAWTSAGVFDGYFEQALAPWDVAAGALLVREAGGVVTDWSGDQHAWLDSGDIVAAPRAVHSRILELTHP